MIKPQIVVERELSEKDWTLSTFYINGVKHGVGVEDEKRDVKVFGETRIPNGVYEIDFTYSPKFSKSYFVDKDGFISDKKDSRFNKEHLLLTLKNVVGFDRILWHWGNTDLDTHGCYILGTQFGLSKGRKGVLFSRKKYVEVYPILYNLFLKEKKVYVEYKEK